MSDTATKPFWQSMTLWGALITLLAPVLSSLGYDLTPSDIEGLKGSIELVVSGIGGMMIVIGRFRATKKITK